MRAPIRRIALAIVCTQAAGRLVTDGLLVVKLREQQVPRLGLQITYLVFPGLIRSLAAGAIGSDTLFRKIICITTYDLCEPRRE